ncbi:ATPase [Actinopolyspora erythraea]|uniref:ATPase n=1 Tax=Actinopolyspora erythraea TaxID=414996 RepID=A0A099DA23_9ACTN|nr:MinD/ParA family protein [Actinopolyspora erythraea]ASU80303.1 ATPase [Actinopolyspora erythraea]KGI82612.1 ATPase [Actinopolyspora erythraea]
MTGRNDEPDARQDSGGFPAGGGADPNAESSEGSSPTGYVAPEHAAGAPATGGHPEQARQYPASGQQYPQSGPNPVVNPQGNPAASGPRPVPGGDPNQAHSGPYRMPPGTPSGPYPAPGGGSGPYPPPPGQPYPPQGAPAGQPQQPPPGQQPPQPQGVPGWQQQVPPGQQDPAQDLSSAQLLRQSKRPPQSGWRRAIYLASGKTVNPGESPADVHRRELIARINQPLYGCYKIAMLSLKGGVGKTTTTATLGSTFSSLRGDRVVAVDANPDRGTLSQKIPLETTATVRHLLRDAQRIRKYSDVRSYTSQGPSRLEILASEQDPAVSEAFSESDYRTTVDLLEHFYNVLLTDCGTGLMHSAMKGVLDVADSLVIVSPGSIDGARSASATLDWLDAHGYGELVSRSVAVINSVRPGSGKVDVDKLAAHFASRCRSVSKIPFDPHLEEGAEVDLDQLATPTRLALLELAATVADDFPYAAGRQQSG